MGSLCKASLFGARCFTIAVVLGTISTLSWTFLTMRIKDGFESNTSTAFSALLDEIQMVATADSGDTARRQLYGSQFKDYNCTNSRWRHETKMYNGTYICDGDSFIFGMSKGGTLYWKDLSSGKTRFYFKNKNKTKGVYFLLTIDAKFQVRNSIDEILWEKTLEGYSHDAIGYHGCLKEWPCPYLHLHPDGVVVLNFIYSSTDDWEEININKGYNFFHWKLHG